MRLLQFLDGQGRQQVGRVNEAGDRVGVLAGVRSMHELAMRCWQQHASLESYSLELGSTGDVSCPEFE